MEVNSYMQEMNNNLNVQEMIKDKILHGGRFGVENHKESTKKA